MDIKLFITDIDGVWTDGGMYYENGGGEFKKFNTSDSAGVLFCKLLDIPVAIITGENSPAVERRAQKLKINDCFLHISNKVKIAEGLLEKYELAWEQVAYIGDDINDIDLLEKVGLSACPISAPYYIQEIVDWVIPTKGGDGVFRHFVEKYLQEQGLMDHVLEKFKQTKELEQ